MTVGKGPARPRGQGPVERERSAPWDLVGLVPALLFVLLFSALPLAALAIGAWSSEGGGTGLISLLWAGGQVGQLVRQGLENSLVQGALSASLAFAWGLPVGTFLGRHRFRGRDTFLAFLLVPFLLPVLVVVLGVQELFAAPAATGGAGGFLVSLWPATKVLGSGLPGILTVNVFYNTTMVALFTLAGVAQAPAALEDAVATLGGGPWRAFRDVWGRPALLGAATGTLLTFLFSFLSFAPPIVLSGGGYATYTIEDWIYALFQQHPGVPLGVSLAVSLWTMALLLLPSLAYVLLARRLHLFSGSATSSQRGGRPLSLGSLHPFRLTVAAPCLAATVLLLLFVGALMGAVVVGSFLLPHAHTPTGLQWGTANWQYLFSPQATAQDHGISTWSSLGNTLFFATASTLLLLLVGIVAGFSRVRHQRAGLFVDLFSFLPLLASPVILALALWSFYYSSLYTPAWLWVLILGAQAGLALPFVLQTMSTAFRANAPAGREAAQTLGASRFRAFLDADVPAARGALVAAALFAFALSLGEFAATNFLLLQIPAFTTLVVEMYVLAGGHLLASGSAGPTQALGALLVLLSLLSFLGILWMERHVAE